MNRLLLQFGNVASKAFAYAKNLSTTISGKYLTILSGAYGTFLKYVHVVGWGSGQDLHCFFFLQGIGLLS